MSPRRTVSDEGDLSGTVVAFAVVLTFLATAAVGLRFYVRGRLLGTIKSEDWCILIALRLHCSEYADSATPASQVALGRHITRVSTTEKMEYYRSSYFQALCYNLSLCFTKVSILLLYLRVLTHEYIRKVTWVVITIVAVYNVWGLGMYLTMCIPIEKMWDTSISGYCHPWSVWWALTYLHIITDFMIFVIPIPVVSTMTIPKRQKAGILIVFSVGLFVCLISVLRAVWLNQLLYSADMTWHFTAIANWSSTELNLAVVCGCMPTLKPVLTKIFGPLMDRLFPPEHQSLEDSGPSNARPRTVGSMPMKALKFGRQPKSQNSSGIHALSESSWADRGTLAMTAVETNGSESCRQDVDPEAGRNVDGETLAIELSERPGTPPRAYVKD
ncbi:Phosphoglucosamine mutase [Madurella mycetomatis]|uniref:Phosphoglucosamine mutase n=1 Tax=Madurella mycetomatis TaxID=100816 RepID=A0A175VQW3_9PEZI|nr:Phosphoglucosamine mutase [Madurella mycetomatis]